MVSKITRIAFHRSFSAPHLRLSLQGSGLPVVLNPGEPADPRSWDALAERLSGGGLGRRCHVMQYASESQPGPASIDQQAADAARAIREWGRWPVIWIGRGLGLQVGRVLAAGRPDLVTRVLRAGPDLAEMLAEG